MNGTNRTSRKKQSKQHRRSNRSNSPQAITGQLSKKQQAILNAPVKFGDEVLVTIHGIGSSGEGVGRVDDFTVFVPFEMCIRDRYCSGYLDGLCTVIIHPWWPTIRP